MDEGENNNRGIDMSSQKFYFWMDDAEYVKELPSADVELLPGIKWGEPGTLFTPSYWMSQYWMAGLDKVSTSPYTTSTNLAEELTFCLLGGFGITAELATAAFEHCKTQGLISSLDKNPKKWEDALSEKLNVRDKQHHYRYPKQKAKYLAAAMSYLREHDLSHLSGRQLRDELLKINGIGPKTAGWITRNYADADDVAILDIHLVRAGVLGGFINKNQKVETNYFDMEASFIQYCSALNVRPAVLDCLIWDQMRELGQLALDCYKRICGEEKTTDRNKNIMPEHQFSLFSSGLNA